MEWECERRYIQKKANLEGRPFLFKEVVRIIFIIAMLYCDAATFCRRRKGAGIMTDETGRRCAQESIDIIIMKNKYNYLFIIKIILITYL